MKDPCISVCKFDEEVCIGCGRTKREIKGWKKLDKSDRKAIMAQAQQRLRSLGATGRRKKK